MFITFARFVRAAVVSKLMTIFTLASAGGLASNSVTPMKKKHYIVEILIKN